VFSRPDVVRRGFCKKVSTVGGFRPFNGFEIAKFGLSRYGVGVGGLEFLGPADGFRELFAERGQEWGPPSFGPWGGGRVRCGGLYCFCECGEGSGEPLVKLVGGGSVRGKRDLPVFEFIGKAWPIDILPGWSGLVAIGVRGA